MDENRVRAYQNLIQLLLTCPAGEEGNVLQEHSEFVDSGLIEVMQEVASRMAADGEQNAGFLQQLAAQLSQALGQGTQGGNADRDSAYLQLINALLNCPNGEESQILNANLELLDAGFLQACKAVVVTLTKQGEENGANFLRNIASQVGEFLGFTSYRDNDVEDKSPDDYEGFLQLLLKTEYDNFGGDSQHIYAVLQANLDKLNLNLIPIFQQTMTGLLGGIEDPEQAENWAALIENIAIKIGQFPRGSRADNLEIAIAANEIVLSVRTFETQPGKWAQTQNNLGGLYFYRIRGERADNIEKAILCYQYALKVRTRDAFPTDWATTKNNLAAAYYSRIRGEKADNIEQAIASFTEALEVRTSNREIIPERWAETQNNLGEAYRQRIKGEREQNIEQAIAYYTAALEVFTRDAFPEQWATTLNNLAITYLLRIRGERAENIEQGLTSFTAALKVCTREAFPQHNAETLCNLGLAYREVPNLQLAYDTFADAINTVELLRGEIHSGDETKQKLAEEWNQLYVNMVEVCIELKNYTAAIEYAERSKARNLVELLATRDLYPKGDIPETVINELSRLRREMDAEQRRVDIEQTNRNSNGGRIWGERSPQIDNLQSTIRDQTNLTQLRQQLNELIDREIKPIDPDFALTQEVKGISYSEIKSLTANNTALLQWYITIDQFLTFIITPESPTPIVWQSSPADFEALINWFNQYLTDYRTNKTQWQQNLASRLQNLAKILHLNDLLGRVPKHCSQLILIPHRFLHLLPLHALPVSRETWQRFNSEPSSPEPSNPYLLDSFKQGVRYAPSCQLLQQAQRRKRDNFTRIFAIANPTKDRYLMELEAANICDRFKPNDFLVKKDDANKKAIQSQQLSLANCAHFGCHGKFEPDSPLESYLKLANNARLTLLEILNLDLNQCRLVTLSACETGLTESKTSDEYIGLPFGFLLAGSPSMVSTLWEVDQLASTLLLMRFYENLETLSTAAALNEAQQWLRNLTTEGLKAVLKRLKPQIDQVFEQLSQKDRTLLVEARLNRALNRKPFPFAEPHYWAGFTAIGV